MSGRFLIVTGPPGCGKTFFSNEVVRFFPSFKLFSYDSLKEKYWDEFGFNSLEERDNLNKKSISEFYKIVEHNLSSGDDCLVEYPFCKRHETNLQALSNRVGATTMTCFLRADYNVLFGRWNYRDLNDEKRHPGHMCYRYHKDLAVSNQDYFPRMKLHEFIRTCEAKDYDIIIGERIIVDVTDFSKVDYVSIFKKVAEYFDL